MRTKFLSFISLAVGCAALASCGGSSTTNNTTTTPPETFNRTQQAVLIPVTGDCTAPSNLLCGDETFWGRTESPAPPAASCTITTCDDVRLPQPKKGGAGNAWGSYFAVGVNSGVTEKVLYAGQWTPVGTATITADAAGITVVYDVPAPNTLSEAHIYLGCTAPTTNAPGQFPYNGGNTANGLTLGPIPYSSIGGCSNSSTTVYVALHGVVGPADSGNPCVGPIVIGDGELSPLACGVEGSGTIQVTGGVPPYSGTIDGAPAWLEVSLDQCTGEITLSGTPDGNCLVEYAFTIEISDSCPCNGPLTASATFSASETTIPDVLEISPLTVDCEALENGAQFSATGGNGEYTFTLCAPVQGLSITESGVVTSDATYVEGTGFSVCVVDSACCQASGSQDVTIEPCIPETLEINPQAISCDELQNGGIQFGAEGGNGDYTFTLCSAVPGLSISASGLLTMDADYVGDDFAICVVDSGCCQASGSQPYTGCTFVEPCTVGCGETAWALCPNTPGASPCDVAWGMSCPYVVGQGPVVNDLVAGQHINIGTVTYSDDGENLYVTYETTVPGTNLSLAHVYAGLTPPPNCAPGQFPYHSGDSTCPGVTTDTITIPLASIGATDGSGIYIAAHADTCD